jgi:hypothetical protein
MLWGLLIEELEGAVVVLQIELDQNRDTTCLVLTG